MSAVPGPEWRGVAVWRRGALELREDCEIAPAELLAADSWLVVDGAIRALELHRSRFLAALASADSHAAGPAADIDAAAFWERAIAAIPRAGRWFPRVEARRVRGAIELQLRMREAPELRRSLVLVGAEGDPRRHPETKGPDLEAMLRMRTLAQAEGADESVILEPDGAVAEASTSCLVWWRGDLLCYPDPGIRRIDSVTVRSVLAIAAAVGTDTLPERARPDQLEGCEIWALNALHGARIVTAWIGGPQPAEEPGRLARWQARLDALRRPLPSAEPSSEPEPAGSP